MHPSVLFMQQARWTISRLRAAGTPSRKKTEHELKQHAVRAPSLTIWREQIIIHACIVQWRAVHVTQMGKPSKGPQTQNADVYYTHAGQALFGYSFLAELRLGLGGPEITVKSFCARVVPHFYQDLPARKSDRRSQCVAWTPKDTGELE